MVYEIAGYAEVEVKYTVVGANNDKITVFCAHGLLKSGCKMMTTQHWYNSATPMELEMPAYLFTIWAFISQHHS